MRIKHIETGIVFDTPLAASRHFKIKRSSIMNQLEGKYKTADGGHKFVKVPTRKKKPRLKIRNDLRRRVKCSKLNRYFSSCGAAARHAGVNPTRMNNHLQFGKPAKLNGHVYCYADDQHIEDVIEISTGRIFHTYNSMMEFCGEMSLEPVIHHLQHRTKHLNGKTFRFYKDEFPTIGGDLFGPLY